jgi:hypothetical protein
VNFANRLRKIFASDQVKNSESASAVDLRFHVRIKPAFDNIVFVESNALKQVRLVDISYGGAAITTSTIVTDDSPINIIFHAIDSAFELTAKPVHRRGQQLGLSFVHDNADGLVFLRDIIENMKSGASMAKIPRDMLKVEFQEVGASVWRGDGPTDLMYFPEGSEPKQKTGPALLVNFRDGKEYYQVNIIKGRIITSKSRSTSEPELHRASDFMKTSHAVDLDVLRKALLVFCGTGDAELKKVLGGFTAEALAQFNQNLRLVK